VATRKRILDTRDAYLAQREQKYTQLFSVMNLGEWGSEVTEFLRQQVRAERKWISRLKRKAVSTRATVAKG
jgi:hypothetical protein